MSKFTNDGKDADCITVITQHRDYNVITHRTVLETAGALLSDKLEKCKILSKSKVFYTRVACVG